MKETNRYVGIDLSKRTYQCMILDEKAKNQQFNGKTDEVGLERLATRLNQDDLVGIEAGNNAFNLARFLMTRVGCQVVILNPGKLKMIYQSLKKTDKEDALQIARLLQRNPVEELPTVPLPTKKEEEERAIVSELIRYKADRTRYINRLHSVFLDAGITTITKADLKTVANREKNVSSLLTGRYLNEATRLVGMVASCEEIIDQLEEETKKYLESEKNTEILMSVPGVGPSTALAFIAFVGDGSRFENADQVANYVGLTPRVDSSGETHRMGSISKRGCAYLRRAIVLAAWALIRSKNGGPFKQVYQDLITRKPKAVAIIAIARRLIKLLYTLVKNGTYYRYSELKERLAKLKYYKFELIGLGA
jgi:transposase